MPRESRVPLMRFAQEGSGLILTNISVGWKYLSRTNTLGYCEQSLSTDLNSLIAFRPEYI